MAMRHTYNEFFGQLDQGAVFQFKKWGAQEGDLFMKINRELPGNGEVDYACVCIYSSDRSNMGKLCYPADCVEIVECSWQIKFNPDKQGAN